MKPILKWTGGKSTELDAIKLALPTSYKRLIEPFLGGGAVFFDFENTASVVNDFNKELITFYEIIQTSEYQQFKEIIEIACAERKAVGSLPLSISNLDQIIKDANSILDNTEYHSFVKREINSKNKTIRRINYINLTGGKSLLTDEEMSVQYRTGIYASLYYMYRKMYNTKNLAKTYDIEHISYWFIMRELAYSGMFRFSSKGNFNVPYGGISYNTKDMSKKLTHIEKVIVKPFYNLAEFNNCDFEQFFIKYDYFTEDDFIFLDPPYDSEFSQYNVEEDFTRNDQERLRDVLLKTKAKIMVVIKETEYIKSLYEKDFNITTINKLYTVNFRNRHKEDQKVVHLVITNY